MICKECQVTADAKGLSGTNTLLCSESEHTKLNKDHLFKITSQLLLGFSQSIQEVMALSCTD